MGSGVLCTPTGFGLRANIVQGWRDWHYAFHNSNCSAVVRFDLELVLHSYETNGVETVRDEAGSCILMSYECNE